VEKNSLFPSIFGNEVFEPDIEEDNDHNDVQGVQ
jgi:hypothetical protein